MTAQRQLPGPIVVFAMPEAGHVRRLESLIVRIVETGTTVYVFTDSRLRAMVEWVGGTFVDLFARHPIEAADSTSRPVPCRFVSFAGVYGDAIADEVRELRPSLVVYDTFAVIGVVVARRLGIPYVNVCAGHQVVPHRFLEELHHDPRVDVSPACWRAVEILRHRYGIADASPFSYVSALSPYLNVYCEPPEYLDPAAREAFEPVMCFGSLPDGAETTAHHDRPPPLGSDASGQLTIYISFGTVIWRYYADQAARILITVVNAAAARPRTRVLVSLGGAPLDDATRARLDGANVTVSDYVDQWNALAAADILVTHHGLNTTHEAIFHRVPMISYPFFWDQPALATQCQALGLAVPLTPQLRGDISAADAAAAIDTVRARRDAMHEALERARQWEVAVTRERPKVVRRILELAS